MYATIYNFQLELGMLLHGIKQLTCISQGDSFTLSLHGQTVIRICVCFNFRSTWLNKGLPHR